MSDRQRTAIFPSVIAGTLTAGIACDVTTSIHAVLERLPQVVARRSSCLRREGTPVRSATMASRPAHAALAIAIATILGMAPVAMAQSSSAPPPAEPPDQPRTTEVKGGSFRQGLWHGEDPRVSSHDGWYYYVENPVGAHGHRSIYKSRSLIERGEPRALPDGFPLFAPLWIERMNDVDYHKWYAFDGQVWECSGDPYDSAPDGWWRTKAIPFRHWTIDHFVFQAHSGPLSGQWFMVWAGQERADNPGVWWFESIYISRMLSLRDGEPTLADADDSPANRIINYRISPNPMTYPVPPAAAGSWKDVVVEAPCVVEKGGTFSIVHSGNGAQTFHYALGIAFCRDGNLLNPGSWVDWNQDVNPGPEFAGDRARGVFGPGVARIVPSPDGREDWMYYHVKIWDTGTQADSIPEAQRQIKEMWDRYVCCKQISWRTAAYGGRTYTIPSLGVPDAPGTQKPLPGGDAGVKAHGAQRIEACRMIPFGQVMSPEVQGIPGDGDVLRMETDAPPIHAFAGHFDLLAAAAPDHRAGLLYRNTRGGRTLIVSAASPLPHPRIDILIAGALRRTLALAQTASWSAFTENACAIDIPPGSDITLSYKRGAGDPCNIDYIILKDGD